MVGRVVGWVDNVDVGTNDPHANRASDSTDEQQLSSAQLVNQEQEPDKCHDGLYDTKETSQEIDGIGLNTKTLLKELVTEHHSKAAIRPSQNIETGGHTEKIVGE